MTTDKLKVIELIKEMIYSIDKYFVNFPNKEKELKAKIINSSYDLLSISYEANITTDLKRKLELQEKAFALIKLLDFLINICYEKQIINSKRYFKFGESFESIVKYYTGWINATKRSLKIS